MARQGKNRRIQRRGKREGGSNRNNSKSNSSAGNLQRDSFFENNSGSKKRRRGGDEELSSSEEEDIVGLGASGGGEDHFDDNEEVETEDRETADEKRLRIAKAYLNKIKDSAKDSEEEDGDGSEDEDGGERYAEIRDARVGELLNQQQLESSGRVQRKLASRFLKTSAVPEGKNVSRRHRQSVTAVILTEDDSRGFSASKDGAIVHWDTETGQTARYDWPSGDVSTSSTGETVPRFKNKGSSKIGSKHVLALAVSSDGRHLAAGGLNRTVHLWDTRSREHIQAFPGHKGAISSLVFRQGTQQLMSGSYDRTIKLWSVDDRSYIDTLYGHQSDVLALDCLRQERVLSAGRDRTLRLWKVPEESQLVFRGHSASMDCCCFISNGEFLSGSDDGSLGLWSFLRKKPVFVANNVHGPSSLTRANSNSSDDENPEEEKTHMLPNGHANGNGSLREEASQSITPTWGGGGAASSWIGAVAVCRGSDLAASGAGDGTVKLWAIEDGNKSLRALSSFPVKGFVNSLAIAHTGRFLLAGVGQEPRLGRWGRIPEARNGVVQHVISLA